MKGETPRCAHTGLGFFVEGVRVRAGTDVKTGEGKGNGSGWVGRVRTKRGRLPTVRNDGNAREGRKGGGGEKNRQASRGCSRERRNTDGGGNELKKRGKERNTEQKKRDR